MANNAPTRSSTRHQVLTDSRQRAESAIVATLKRIRKSQRHAGSAERIQIRAGSVVLPLHNPVRVAEEWSVVDNRGYLNRPELTPE